MTTQISDQPKATSIGWYRWRICAFLFFATTINYVDRQVIGILKPVLSSGLGWNEIDYSNVVFAFQVAYAIGYVGAGWFVDRVGVKLGYSLAVLLWSIAEMAHALNWYVPVSAKILSLAMPGTVLGFCAARFALGIAEGGNFPAAIKTISEWFPKKERALATGIFNSGSNVGAIAAPLIVPVVTAAWGWPAAFWITGALGLIWLIFWYPAYSSPQSHQKVSQVERNYILSDPQDPIIKIKWRSLLKYKQTWVIIVGMALSAPIWWFYLYWVPDFLNKKYGLNLLQMGAPLIAIYLMADVGSIGGGWLSSRLIKQGWSVNKSRKTALLVCAICVVPVFWASKVSNLWLATFIVGLAASAHQGFSANLFTLVSDTAPKQVVSSLVGLGGMAGAIGGMFIAKLAGYILQWTGEYKILFAIASCVYLVNLLIIHVLNPKHERMIFSEN
jgi:ACS family hexuronate transporter-like MFS transporter